MMPNRAGDPVFQLIQSLQKGEKRNFKLYCKRNSSNEDLKIIQLFDALDRMDEYDEAVLLKKLPSLKKEQLANRKAHLYKQVLDSLRLLETSDNIDLELHAQIDHARILYNKGLYLQSLKVLDRAKENARSHNQYSFLVQILFMEKKIEALHITRSFKDRAHKLAEEADEVVGHLALITKLSNLSLELYGWYINHGHARNEAEEKELQRFFNEAMQGVTIDEKDFYQRLYYYQSWCWYAFIRQDFLMYYRYTSKWVDLFDQQPLMVGIETMHYIKGVHNLLNAHFDLDNQEKFERLLEKFEQFSQSEQVQKSSSNTIQVFVYLYTSRINKHFMKGSFREGLAEVPVIEEKLKEYAPYLDRHRVLVFYYKIASLYFGSGDADTAITYLNRIINWKTDLRSDLQCYARLLHLIAHYELGNLNLLEYLVKSVYRFMAKMENLGPVEEDVFKFLQKAFHLSPNQLLPEFQLLHERLSRYRDNRLAARAFAYLDILSWLESKTSKKPLQEIIKEKAKGRKRIRLGLRTS